MDPGGGPAVGQQHITTRSWPSNRRERWTYQADLVPAVLQLLAVHQVEGLDLEEPQVDLQGEVRDLVELPEADLDQQELLVAAL